MDMTPIVLALIGLVGAICTGFFKLVNDQNKVHEKIANGLGKLTDSGENQASAMRAIADETKQGNREAKERNGHLAELQLQQADKIIRHVGNVKMQHVGKQVVDEQEVKVETVGKVIKGGKK